MEIRFDRLQRLAHILSDLTDEQVDLDEWRHHCGSTACALGWACMDPEFIREGLSFSHSGSPHFDTRVEGASDDERHLYNFTAGAAFFGLGEGNGDVLFGLRCFGQYDDGAPEGIDDRGLALYRIRRLFEDNGVPFGL